MKPSLPAAYFPSAQTPLTRRLLVYFHAAAYIGLRIEGETGFLSIEK
jgi:hypothetical protein